MGDQPAVAVRWGLILNAIITFIIVALVVFLISRRFLPHDPGDPATATCPYCLEPVAIGAKRCRSCTSDLTESAAER